MRTSNIERPTSNIEVQNGGGAFDDPDVFHVDKGLDKIDASAD